MTVVRVLFSFSLLSPGSFGFTVTTPKIHNKQYNLILIFVENYLEYDAIHDFSVCLRSGSNPADINRFRSYTGKHVIVNSVTCF